MSQYLYQRKGGQVLDWRRGAPQGYRAAETRSLGSLGALDVLRPGAPEVLTGLGATPDKAQISTMVTRIAQAGGLARESATKGLSRRDIAIEAAAFAISIGKSNIAAAILRQATPLELATWKASLGAPGTIEESGVTGPQVRQVIDTVLAASPATTGLAHDKDLVYNAAYNAYFSKTTGKMVAVAPRPYEFSMKRALVVGGAIAVVSFLLRGRG